MTLSKQLDPKRQDDIAIFLNRCLILRELMLNHQLKPEELDPVLARMWAESEIVLGIM